MQIFNTCFRDMDFQDLLVDEGEKVKSKDASQKPVKRRKSAVPKPKPPKRKRPAGISREAYRLLNSGILAVEEPTELIKSVMPTNIGGYKEKKILITPMTKTHRYNWVPFINQARSDNLQLFHWEREDRHEEVYKYAHYNKVLQLETYTDEIYKKNFSSTANWTKDETDHLFDLAQRFDLRWVIIHDRYDKTKFKPRSIEDLKERYYAIVNHLQLLKDPNTSVHNYDAEHERLRKRQLEKQWNRTEEQLEEEQELIRSLKIHEATRKSRAKKAAELQAYMDSVVKEEEAAYELQVPEVVQRVARKSLKTRKAEIAKFTMESEMKHFRSHLFRTAGPHLRSYENVELRMRLTRRENNIVALLKACGLPEYHLYNTEEIVKLINEFKANVCLLQDLKDSLIAAEYELMVLQQKYPEKKVEVPPMFKLTPINGGPVPKEDIGKEGMPTTSRRLISLLVKKESKINEK